MDNSTSPPEARDALSAFVAELVGTASALMSIVDHMERSAASGRSAPNAPSVPQVLAVILRDVLEPLGEAYARDDLETATEVLAEVGEIACAEIFLVPIGDDNDCAPSRNVKAPPRRRRRR
jgi:hypothetical protein